MDDETSWGTWEELLLAFAVKRYGTSSWDSISLQIKKRSSSTFTPLSCMLRFNHLKSRYNNNNNDASSLVPWLDDLRNRRIAELKNQLEHYDLSIVSLQSKVKRLKEEREESFRGCDEKLGSKNGSSEVKLEGFMADKVIEDEVGGKDDNLEAYEVKPGNGMVRTESCNGSTDSISKEMGKMAMVKIETEVGVDEFIEVCETVAESKKLGEIESSDVHSTTSRLSKEENEKLRFGSCVGAGLENESLHLKEMSSGSQSLIEFLETLQSYKLGLVSERLLDSQETSNYRNLVRQHIDIKSVYRNVGGGYYSDSEHKFFRDLLLLVNNAILFFEKNTSESNAATEIRQHISEKLVQRNSKADLTAGKQTSLPPISLLSEQAREPSDFWKLKSGIEGISRVSRKRSSFAARSSISSSSGSERWSLEAAAMHKPVVESKQTTKSPAADKRRQITQRRTTNGSALNSRSSKKNSKNLASTPCDEDPVIISERSQEKMGSSTELLQSKGEKNTASTGMARSAANFLDRLNKSSPPNNEPFIDTLENSMSSPHRGEKAKQKGSRSIKGGSKKDKVTKSCEGKLLNEESSLTRRQLGRPPKRAAAPTPVLAGSGKCSRAIGHIDAEAPKQPKKRSRK